MKTLIERDELVLNYLPLAISTALQQIKKCPSRVELDDLKSAAYVGLIEAADRFDPSTNNAFGSFARPRIIGAVLDWIRDMYQNDQRYVSSDEIEIAFSSNNFEEFFEDFSYSLSDIERKIVFMYYIENYSLKEIGNFLSMTEARISQILKKTKETLCEPSSLC